ncbi:MAG TPA: glycosyltransferase [bacterium]|nr:glycosyltransferase [bacterium]
MRILFINKSDAGGGAATAMMRIADGVAKLGTENYFIVAKRKSGLSNVYATRGRYGWLIEEAIDRMTRRFGAEGLCFPFSGPAIRRMAHALKPDRIVLNNIHSGYFPLSLMSELARIAPLYWLVHDLWPVTGHCMAPIDCSNWQDACGNCPRLDTYPSLGSDRTKKLAEGKRRIYDEVRPVFIVASRWMEDILRKSPLTAHHRIVRIPHGIPADIFNPQDKNSARKRFGITDHAPVLLFAAEHLDNRLKGGDLLCDILQRLDEQLAAPVHLVVSGKGKLPFPTAYRHIKVHSTGYLPTGDLPLLYSAADILLFPSQAESFGLTPIEAASCGAVPVVFGVGPLAENIIEGKTGVVIPPFDTAFFAAKVAALLNDPEARNHLSTAGREHIMKEFAPGTVAESYFELFGK